MADESSDGSEKDRNAPTVRDLKGPGVSGDTLPDVVGVYVPPRPLPESTAHRTIDVKPVRLSAAADPRQALTERRLVSPPRVERRLPVLWLGGGIAILLALGAWAFLQELSSPSAVSPARVPSAPAPVNASAARLSAPVQRSAGSLPEPAPLRSAAPLPSASPAAHGFDAPPAATKAGSTRETQKKRKDPWLE
jgi:hypothetical protein